MDGWMDRATLKMIIHVHAHHTCSYSPFLPLILVLKKFFKLLHVTCVKTAISLSVKHTEPGPFTNLQSPQTRKVRLQPAV